MKILISTLVFLSFIIISCTKDYNLLQGNQINKDTCALLKENASTDTVLLNGTWQFVSFQKFNNPLSIEKPFIDSMYSVFPIIKIKLLEIIENSDTDYYFAHATYCNQAFFPFRALNDGTILPKKNFIRTYKYCPLYDAWEQRFFYAIANGDCFAIKDSQLQIFYKMDTSDINIFKDSTDILNFIKIN